MSGDAAQIAREVIQASQGGPPVAVATVIRAPEAGGAALGAKLLVRADGAQLGSISTDALGDAIAADCRTAFSAKPRVHTQSFYYRANGERLHRLEAGSDEFEVLIEVTERPATLVIIGAGHIGQSLATLGAHIGLSVVVVDDREEFANKERFPMADRIICGDLEEEIDRLVIDHQTYVVLVSRGHKQDELSLRRVVESDAVYVGMIGSRRRVGTVLTHLAREGYSREALDRVHTPIGLDIGAETPEEIAVSILAEIISVRRGGSGQKMSDVRRAKIRE